MTFLWNSEAITFHVPVFFGTFILVLFFRFCLLRLVLLRLPDLFTFVIELSHISLVVDILQNHRFLLDSSLDIAQ